MEIWQTLGTPSQEQMQYFSELPFFSKQLPRMEPKTFAAIFEEEVPPDFAEIFGGCLKLLPTDRMTASAALACHARFESGAKAGLVAMPSVGGAVASALCSAAPSLQQVALVGGLGNPPLEPVTVKAKPCSRATGVPATFGKVGSSRTCCSG